MSGAVHLGDGDGPGGGAGRAGDQPGETIGDSSPPGTADHPIGDSESVGEEIADRVIGGPGEGE